MIIKNFLNKIRFDKITYIFIFLCLITGLFKEIISILLLIIIHELGHYIVAYCYRIDIRTINIYPFGGVIKYDSVIDRPFKEELLINIMGPVFQIVLYIVISLLNRNYLISDYFFNIFKNYHYSMLLLNVIPVIPLDGSKLLNIFLNKIFNYQLSYKMLFYISVVITVILIIYFNNYSYIFVISFIMIELFYYIKNKNYMFNRFIYERYLFDNKYKKYKKVNSIDKMYRNKKNLIKYNKIYLTEKECIKKIKGV